MGGGVIMNNFTLPNSPFPVLGALDMELWITVAAAPVMAASQPGSTFAYTVERRYNESPGVHENPSL